MPRLPVPGSDAGQWGDILNEYLSQAHNLDGTLKNGAVSTQHIAVGSVAEDNLSPGVVAKLNDTTPGATGPAGPAGPTGPQGLLGLLAQRAHKACKELLGHRVLPVFLALPARPVLPERLVLKVAQVVLARPDHKELSARLALRECKGRQVSLVRRARLARRARKGTKVILARQARRPYSRLLRVSTTRSALLTQVFSILFSVNSQGRTSLAKWFGAVRTSRLAMCWFLATRCLAPPTFSS